MSDRRATLGARGEQLAVARLQADGYRIISQNYRCALGEIDIVAMERDCLVICEVKTRRTSAAGHPSEAVTPQKQARLRRLGEYYWQFETDGSQALRFDVLAVTDAGGTIEIDHLIDVF